MKLINILKEIRVLPAGSARRLSPQDLQDINVVFEFFGESDSDFDLHKPMTEYRFERSFKFDDEEFDDEEDDRQYQAFKRLVKKPKGVYLGTDSYISPCPGAPDNSFYMCLEVYPNGNANHSGPFIVLSMPYYDTDAGRYSVGWFDGLGKYHADTAHFNEDGEYIG
jgi:hypothetical protein